MCCCESYAYGVVVERPGLINTVDHNGRHASTTPRAAAPLLRGRDQHRVERPRRASHLPIVPSVLTRPSWSRSSCTLSSSPPWSRSPAVACAPGSGSRRVRAKGADPSQVHSRSRTWAAAESWRAVASWPLDQQAASVGSVPHSGFCHPGRCSSSTVIAPFFCTARRERTTGQESPLQGWPCSSPPRCCLGQAKPRGAHLCGASGAAPLPMAGGEREGGGLFFASWRR